MSTVILLEAPDHATTELAAESVIQGILKRAAESDLRDKAEFAALAQAGLKYMDTGGPEFGEAKSGADAVTAKWVEIEVARVQGDLLSRRKTAQATLNHAATELASIDASLEQLLDQDEIVSRVLHAVHDVLAA